MYTVLLIVTIYILTRLSILLDEIDGVICDMPQTIDAIVQASTLPLSVSNNYICDENFPKWI